MILTGDPGKNANAIHCHCEPEGRGNLFFSRDALIVAESFTWPAPVTPPKAEIHAVPASLDARLRGHDGEAHVVKTGEGRLRHGELPSVISFAKRVPDLCNFGDNFTVELLVMTEHS